MAEPLLHPVAAERAAESSGIGSHSSLLQDFHKFGLSRGPADTSIGDLRGGELEGTAASSAVNRASAGVWEGGRDAADTSNGTSEISFSSHAHNPLQATEGHGSHAAAGSSSPFPPTASGGAETTATASGVRRVSGRRLAGRATCEACGVERAAVKRPKTGQQVCRGCFSAAFEEEVHATITKHRLFKPGDRVAIGASGGKDSTVLARVLSKLNRERGYGLQLFLLSVDEGIAGYRDDSLETVKRNEKQYGLPLTVVSYRDLYGWSMDEIVAAIGRKNNCTFCGVFRRQALDRGAALLSASKLATGHNADDMAETVLLNLLRGDVARLSRCSAIVTGEDSALPRCKPFKYTYEKEIVMYAHFHQLDYFSTECIYSPDAYRGFARSFIKDLEATRPRAILDIIRSAEEMCFQEALRLPVQSSCQRCGYIASQALCKACSLLQGLNRGLPRLGLTRTRPRGGGKAEAAASGERSGGEQKEGPAAVAVSISGAGQW